MRAQQIPVSGVYLTGEVADEEKECSRVAGEEQVLGTTLTRRQRVEMD